MKGTTDKIRKVQKRHKIDTVLTLENWNHTIFNQDQNST